MLDEAGVVTFNDAVLLLYELRFWALSGSFGLYTYASCARARFDLALRLLLGIIPLFLVTALRFGSLLSVLYDSFGQKMGIWVFACMALYMLDLGALLYIVSGFAWFFFARPSLSESLEELKSRRRIPNPW